MNYEEGYRRIGIVIICMALIVGGFYCISGEFVKAIALAAFIVVAGYGLMWVSGYVIRGFMKKPDGRGDGK